jgi:hypothetical protein
MRWSTVRGVLNCVGSEVLNPTLLCSTYSTLLYSTPLIQTLLYPSYCLPFLICRIADEIALELADLAADEVDNFVDQYAEKFFNQI